MMLDIVAIYEGEVTDLSLWVGPEEDCFDGLHGSLLPSVLTSVRICVLNSGPLENLCARQDHAFVKVYLDSRSEM
jgi:hypothetical protein